MKKKFFALLLVLTMAVSLLPVAALAEEYPIADDMAEMHALQYAVTLGGDYAISDDIAVMLQAKLAVVIDRAMRLSRPANDDPYAIDDLMI